MKTPNIFYIHTHDSGRFISPYGYAFPSPNIDDFSKGACLFRNCFCAAPTCSPSRAALLTGMAPHQNGMCGLAHRGWSLNSYSDHLVQILKGSGYETVLCGIQHEAPSDDMIGYDAIVGSRDYAMGKTEDSMETFDYSNTQSIVDYLESRKNDASPLFVSLGWYNTHREFPAVNPDISVDNIFVPAILPDTKEIREDMAGYASSLMVVDRCFGQFIQSLKSLGLYDDSLIIFTTDHGPAFPGMKGTLYDAGAGVFLIMKMPGQKKGMVLDQMVSHYDVLPTILDMLDIESKNSLIGKSMLNILEGAPNELHDEIFIESSFHAAYEPKRAIRTKRWKYIIHFDPNDDPVLCNIDSSESKDFLLSNGLKEHPVDRVQLFDLYLDPTEKINLAGNTKYKEIESTLYDKLHSWMESTDDPLLDGWEMPRPVGAIINKKTCISPREKDYECVTFHR